MTNFIGLRAVRKKYCLETHQCLKNCPDTGKSRVMEDTSWSTELFPSILTRETLLFTFDTLTSFLKAFFILGN